MQPARIKPHAKEHTNNPVQKPNFRGHAAGDVEVTRACGKALPLARGSRAVQGTRQGPFYARDAVLFACPASRCSIGYAQKRVFDY